MKYLSKGTVRSPLGPMIFALALSARRAVEVSDGWTM
jgi:hypothetical protein